MATVGAGSWTIGGTTSKIAVSGTATFTDLTATSAATVTGATIIFISTGLGSATSATFNIPAPDYISLSSLGLAYTQDFNTLASSGTSSATPQGWSFSETGTALNTIYTASDGTGTSGDTYSFGTTASSDRAFGTLQSGSLTSTIGAKFKNNTGAVINNLKISYTGEQWRLGALGRVDRLDFQYSTTATALATGTYTDENNLDFTAPVTTGTVGAIVGNTTGNKTALSYTITGLSIANGADFWIRWADFNATGSDDGLGIDDFSLTACQSSTASIASNNGPICSGSDAIFNLTGTTGATVTYTINDGANQTVVLTGGTAIVTITGATATQKLTLVSVGNGSCSQALSGISTVSINAAPSITNVTAPAASICATATQVLTANGVAGAGASVTWWTATGGTGTQVGSGNTSNPVGSGTYYAYVTGICTPAAESFTTVGTLANTSITVDAAPSIQTLFINDPTPTAITITAAGASLSYQWYYNTTNSNNPVGATTVGTNSNSYTPPTNVLGTKYYFCVVTGTCGTATSSTATVTITNSNTWTAGAATTNWSTGANWSLGTPPNSTNDAVVPFGNTPYPVLSTSSAINDLIIDNGATVGIGAGNTFTITGVVTGTGTISGSATSNLTTTGTTSVLFTPAANTLKDLTVSSGTLTLGNGLNITAGTASNTYGTVTVSSGATLASAGNLTIKSNINGTARVAAGSTAGNYITGDVTVERYINQNAKRAWRLLSIPTKGSQTMKQSWQENQAANANGVAGFGTIITSNLATLAIVQAAGFDAYSQTPSVQNRIIVVHNLGFILTATNASGIATNKGYFIYIRGDRTQNVAVPTTSVTPTTLRTTGALYQGNSKPAISVGAGKYEPVGNTYASAIDFTSLTKTGGISNTFYLWDAKLLAGTSLGAYQTFSASVGWVPATIGGSYPASPNTTIESGSAFMVTASGTAGTIALNEGSKTTGNQFNPYRPAAARAQFRTSLYRAATTAVLADNNIVVFDNAYANVVDADDALKIAHAGENMDILTGNQSLIIDARKPVESADVIHFSMKNLTAQQYKLEFTTLNMNTTGLTAFVEDKYLHTSTLINLDATSEYSFTVDANAASKAADRLSVVFKKAGVLPVSNVKAITVSPNPVEGGVANVQFKNQPKGRYSINLLGNAGQIVYTMVVEHAGGTSTQLLNIPANVARGAYQLEVIAPNKTRQVQTLFINTTK